MSVLPRAAVAAAGLCCLASVQAPGAPAASTAPSSTQAAWPQWRGPQGTGVAPVANPPTTWSETENVRWKVNLPGSGTGTPIVWNDRVFIQAAVPAAGPAAALGAGGQPSDQTRPGSRRG